MLKGCSHGKTFNEPCTECRIVLAREGLSWAIQKAEKYSALLSELNPETSPLIERGVGWMKFHFRDA